MIFWSGALLIDLHWGHFFLISFPNFSLPQSPSNTKTFYKIIEEELLGHNLIPVTVMVEHAMSPFWQGEVRCFTISKVTPLNYNVRYLVIFNSIFPTWMFSILVILHSSLETVQWFLSFTNVSRNFSWLKKMLARTMSVCLLFSKNLSHPEWEIWALTIIMAIYCPVLSDYKI